eukprot:612935-Amphidinium_carterae.3
MSNLRCKVGSDEFRLVVVVTGNVCCKSGWVNALRHPRVSMDPRPLGWSCPMLPATWEEKRATALAVHMLTSGDIESFALRLSLGACAARGGHVVAVADASARWCSYNGA